MRAPVVDTIDLKNRLLWLDDGRCFPIRTFDVLDDETYDPEDAVAFVSFTDGVLVTGLVSEFYEPTLH